MKKSYIKNISRNSAKSLFSPSLNQKLPSLSKQLSSGRSLDHIQKKQVKFSVTKLRKQNSETKKKARINYGQCFREQTEMEADLREFGELMDLQNIIYSQFSPEQRVGLQRLIKQDIRVMRNKEVMEKIWERLKQLAEEPQEQLPGYAKQQVCEMLKKYPTLLKDFNMLVSVSRQYLANMKHSRWQELEDKINCHQHTFIALVARLEHRCQRQELLPIKEEIARTIGGINTDCLAHKPKYKEWRTASIFQLKVNAPHCQLLQDEMNLLR